MISTTLRKILFCFARDIANVVRFGLGGLPHRGKPMRMSKAEKRLLKCRHAVEPSIGHLKADHRMRRNFLGGALCDAMNPILAAAVFNIRWLMQWMVIFWRWILSAVLRLPDRSGSDALSIVAPAAA